MKYLPVVISRALVVAGASVSCLLAGTAHAGNLFEDFSKWENGRVDSNKNQILDVLDDGSSMNGWAGNVPYTVQDWPEGKVLAVGGGRARPLAWNQIGKPHELKLAGERAVELTMRVANQRERGASFVSLWLCDEFRNGYGMSYGGIYPMKNRVGVRIFKLRDNVLPFSETKQPKFSTEAGEPQPEQMKSLPDLVSAGQFIDFHLRIEQAAPDAPVTLTLWNTGSQEVADTSYEEPLLRQEDDGKGSVFHGADGSYGPVFNLDALAYVGLSQAQFLNKDLTPEEQAAEPYMAIRQVDIRPVRP